MHNLPDIRAAHYLPEHVQKHALGVLAQVLVSHYGNKVEAVGYVGVTQRYVRNVHAARLAIEETLHCDQLLWLLALVYQEVQNLNLANIN
jgi:hypothetical protein